jgi:hypothetical protein
MSGQAPSINLRCKGQSVPVEIAILLERCSLFRENPRLLASPDYAVTSDVRSTAFSEFVRSLRGESDVFDQLTPSELSQLAREFGSADLLAACASFQDAPATDKSLFERIDLLDERQLLLMRQVETQNAELARLRHDLQSSMELTKSIERRMTLQESQLSGVSRDDDARSAVDALKVALEAEQHYRRGCEHFYGTNGFGVRATDISQRLGLTELRRAADSGHSDAQYVCGRILRECSAFEDAEASTNYMKQAADNGNSYGEMGYARALDFGYGVPQNDPEAFSYYKRAADHGNARGQNGCGYCFELGKGVKKDIAAAAQYYRLGAEQGNGQAMHNFGLCLKDGKGVPKNSKAATDYIRRAKESE